MMIVKILSSSSQDFHGVKYNDKKVNNGAGELMMMKNFPSFINKDSNQEQVRNYLKSISKGKTGRIKKPQFHAVLSTKFQNHSKEELTKVADEFMKEMGYGKQPFILVFHNDTDNNHIHIVSSRVDKTTGKKIDDSFEKLKSQKALSNALEKIYGIKSERDLSLLLQYNFSSVKQLELLLKQNGFKLVTNKTDENKLDVLKNGVKQKTLIASDLNLNFEDIQRKKQLKAIFHKYKDKYSNKVFRVIDDREKNGKADETLNEKAKITVEFESELQHNFRKLFGVDIVFHNKDDKNPFGYTIIDNKTGAVFKGSEIMKMKDLFDFTDSKLDKKTFEKLKTYNVATNEEKKCLLKYLNNEEKKGVEDFMVFQNKTRKRLEDYKAMKTDVISFIRGVKNENVSIVELNEDIYAIHSKYNHIQELESLVGEEIYEEYKNQGVENEIENVTSQKGSRSAISQVLREFERSGFTKSDPYEKELKKKRKKKRR